MPYTQAPELDGYKLVARPDTPDFRDYMYQPTLIDVPTSRPLEEYLAWQVPILDQKTEGACTGCGLAAVANFLLRSRKNNPMPVAVSRRMLYEMARRYDEWPGELYEGSSARGAMKGWFNHGVCLEELWPYRVPAPPEDRVLRQECADDARRRPLGAYYRVNHRDIISMHCALSEVGALYATALVHAGWKRENVDVETGAILYNPERIGGHAFAIVGYDAQGFWIQNSWGPEWGHGGFGLLSYDDWLANGTDAWVARLGVPIELASARATAIAYTNGNSRTQSASYAELQPHVISLGNDGALHASGPFATHPDDVGRIFKEQFITRSEAWEQKRLLLYAHGGLVSEANATQRVAEYRQALLDNEVYPVAFSWRSDFWTTLGNILEDSLRRRRPEGLLDGAKDFMLDRLDDMLEPLARGLTGKLAWDQMKQNALCATTESEGGARLAVKTIAELCAERSDIEIHLIGHSAGSILLAPLVQLLATQGTITGGPLKGEEGLGIKIASCTLWAPACTIQLFKDTYLPVIKARQLERFSLFTLTDQAEQDDNCANIYHKSLLYLVSHAFEERCRVPWLQDGEPLLGMAKHLLADQALQAEFDSPTNSMRWITSPNTAVEVSKHATARSHGGFDDDQPTLRATLEEICLSGVMVGAFNFQRSADAQRDQRQFLFK